MQIEGIFGPTASSSLAAEYGRVAKLWNAQKETMQPAVVKWVEAAGPYKIFTVIREGAALTIITNRLGFVAGVGLAYAMRFEDTLATMLVEALEKALADACKGFLSEVRVMG